MNLKWLLVFIPISLALDRLGADPISIFLASALTVWFLIVPRPGWRACCWSRRTPWSDSGFFICRPN